MTLKECFFLLNEDNYIKTNIFKYRSDFKSFEEKNNVSYLNDLNNTNKIFGNLFSEYYSIYEKNGNTRKDFIVSKTFRENMNNTLNKKHETFQCFLKTIDLSIFAGDPEFSTFIK